MCDFYKLHLESLAGRADRECPNRKYIFERHPRKKLKLDSADIKDVMVSNRSECEDKCLSEFSFVCRSASFDSATRTCTLSRFTRRTHPEKWKDDPTSDYLENTCLSGKFHKYQMYPITSLTFQLKGDATA